MIGEPNFIQIDSFQTTFWSLFFFSRVLKTNISVENLHSIFHDHSTITIHSIREGVKPETGYETFKTNNKISKHGKTLAKKVNKGKIKHDVYVNPL